MVCVCVCVRVVIIREPFFFLSFISAALLLRAETFFNKCKAPISNRIIHSALQEIFQASDAAGTYLLVQRKRATLCSEMVTGL